MRNLFTSMLAMAALVAALWVSPVQAAAFGTVAVTVTLEGVEITVAGSGITFGTTMVPGAAAVVSSEDDVIVTNSSGASVSYWLKLATAGDWTAGATADDEQFVLSAIFNSDQAVTGDFGAGDVLTTTGVECDATHFAGGDEDGYTVADAETHILYLKFLPPSSTTHFTLQTITVTITGELD